MPRHAEAAGHLGHQPRDGAAIDGRVPDPDKEKDDRQARNAPSSARWSTWAWSRTSPSPTSASTRCSSAAAPTAASRTCATPRPWCAWAGGKVAGQRQAGDGGAGLGPGQGAGRAEGLHEVFKAAGFEWREPGCSMCLAMNADRLEPGERCAHQQPQFRRPPGQWWAHPPGQPGHGRRSGDRRATSSTSAASPEGDPAMKRRSSCSAVLALLRLQHHQGHGARTFPARTRSKKPRRRSELQPSPCTWAWWPRWTAPTSTPTPSSPSSS
jgi:hypothetical protein